MQDRSFLLISNNPSRLATRICEIAAEQSFVCLTKSSSELAEQITVYRDHRLTQALPEIPALILSTTADQPVSFDCEFIAQEKETTIRAWAALNRRKVLSCISIEDNDPSISKSSCSIIDQEFNISCRNEIFSSHLPMPIANGSKLWLRDWSSHVLCVVSNTKTSWPSVLGPFWGRTSLEEGNLVAFVVVEQWCKSVCEGPLVHELTTLTQKTAKRLKISVGFVVWWQEKKSKTFLLARINRVLPENLPCLLLDEASQEIIQALTS